MYLLITKPIYLIMKKVIFSLLFASVLVACGSTSNDSDATNDSTEVVIDSTVSDVIDSSSVTENYYGLRRVDGSEGPITKAYTTVQLSSGQCFCAGSGFKYVSTGKIEDISGLTKVEGTAIANCGDSSSCK